MTEEQKQAFQAWKDCVDKQNTVSDAGRDFVRDVLTGNFGGGIGDWAEMVLESTKGGGTNCFELLTPEQREIVGKIVQDYLQARVDQLDQGRHPNRE